jgi:pilus assembly protein Flp/PilA
MQIVWISTYPEVGQLSNLRRSWTLQNDQQTGSGRRRGDDGRIRHHDWIHRGRLCGGDHHPGAKRIRIVCYTLALKNYLARQFSAIFPTLTGRKKMEKLRQKMMELVNDEEGATMVEYGLMVALIAIVCLLAVQLIGTNLNAVFEAIAAAL